MRAGMRTGVIAVCLGLAGHASADQTQAPAGTGQPMNPDEPMEGGMMKPGMQKADVRKSAEKKAEQMKEMLEKEAESMPPMPEQAPHAH